ncbi:Uncharacterised protein [Moraxella lacunata]|uniref:Uncharacterized protein n=1 Tax=Moraxella lacunata TaxID=477 RepID=A0A378T3T3_MORLA|nr:hypothetical protein [Moraxella lacunata]STZ55471.1 Uncharacterised protein [Moraxella lacunata]
MKHQKPSIILHIILMVFYAIFWYVIFLIGSLHINIVIFDDEYRNKLNWENANIAQTTNLTLYTHKSNGKKCHISLYEVNENGIIDFKSTPVIPIYQNFDIENSNIPCGGFDNAISLKLDNLVILKSKKSTNREPIYIFNNKYKDEQFDFGHHYHFISGRVMDKKSPLYLQTITNNTKPDDDKLYYKIKRYTEIAILCSLILFSFYKYLSFIRRKLWIKSGYYFITTISLSFLLAYFFIEFL